MAYRQVKMKSLYKFSEYNFIFYRRVRHYYKEQYICVRVQLHFQIQGN